MTRQEFILEYALRNQAYPSEELLSKLSECFNSSATPVENVIINEDEDYIKDEEDFYLRADIGKYQFVELLEDFRPRSGQFGTFPKGFRFRISFDQRHNPYLSFNIISDSAIGSNSTGKYFNHRGQEFPICKFVKAKLNMKESSLIKKVKTYQKIYYPSSGTEHIRPVYYTDYNYQL